MPPDDSNLANLARRWRNRLSFARCLEAALCAMLGSLLADGVTLALPPAAAWQAAWLIGPAGGGSIALVVAARRRWIAPSAVWPIAWALFGWALVAVMVLPNPAEFQRNIFSPALVAVNLVGAGVAVLAEFLRRPTVARVIRWFDQQTDAHLLLSTAGELSGLDRLDRRGNRGSPLGEVEAAVVARAERLAGRPGVFRQVSAWALPGRTWGLLPMAILAVGLGGLIGVQIRSAPIEETRNGKPTAAVQGKNQSVAPIIAALIDLANQQAGLPLAPVLLKPGQSADQLAAAAAAQVKAWQEDRSLTADKRKELADQLRAAADRIRATDPEVASRLDRAADALAVGDWPKVAAEMAELARQVQSIVAAAPLPAAALMRIRERLRASSSTGITTGPENQEHVNTSPYASTPAVPPTVVDGNNVNPPRSPIPIDPSVRENLSKLPVDQQEVVRRYFAIEK